MGDMADLFLEQSIDDWNDPDSWCEPRPRPRLRRVLRCRQCGKRDLNWQFIKGIWTMFEGDKVHICSGYEPPVEVLREVAKRVLAKTRENAIWRLRDMAKKRGGLLRLLPILPDDQLVDLYACFVRDDCGEPDVGMPASYQREMTILRGEILKRMMKV